MAADDAIAFAGREQVAINSGWEKRFAELGNDESFRVVVELEIDASQQLTHEEYERTRAKLHMVRGLATRLAIGMLKGSLKYPQDAWTEEQWAAWEDDEFADVINYKLLRAVARENEGRAT